MNDTIAVSAFDPTYSFSKFAFFEAQDMTFRNGLGGQVFFVELREKPSMLIRLEAAGYFKSDQKPIWNLMSITEHGITIYLVHLEAGDGYFFIPFANILAIHTADDRWLDKNHARRI